MEEQPQQKEERRREPASCCPSNFPPEIFGKTEIPPLLGKILAISPSHKDRPHRWEIMGCLLAQQATEIQKQD